jgi:hypothetical protein
MDSPFELDVHPTYLHIKQPNGYVISAESSGEIWTVVAELCDRYGRNKVLIEASKPERQLDTMSAFESGRILAENTVGLSIAICFHDYEFDDLSSFFKTVAQNRGVKVEFFSNVDDALRWLDVDTGENAAGNH